MLLQGGEVNDFQVEQTLISTLELEPVKMEMVPKKAGKVKVSFVRQREYYGRYYAYDFVREPPDSKLTVRYLVSNQEAVDVLKNAGGRGFIFFQIRTGQMIFYNN